MPKFIDKKVKLRFGEDTVTLTDGPESVTYPRSMLEAMTEGKMDSHAVLLANIATRLSLSNLDPKKKEDEARIIQTVESVTFKGVSDE